MSLAGAYLRDRFVLGPVLWFDSPITNVNRGGRQVGEMARDRFPGGVLIDFPYHEVDAKIAATKAALDVNRRLESEANAGA